MVHSTYTAIHLRTVMSSIKLPIPTIVTKDWQTMRITYERVFLIYFFQANGWFCPAFYNSKAIQDWPIVIPLKVIYLINLLLRPNRRISAFLAWTAVSVSKYVWEFNIARITYNDLKQSQVAAKHHYQKKEVNNQKYDSNPISRRSMGIVWLLCKVVHLL